VKRLLITFSAVALGFSAHAQTNLPTAAPSVGASAPADVAPAEPLSATSPDNTRYLADPSLLTPCQDRLNAFGNKPCNIIFIGDSSTARWMKTGKAIWDRLYEPRHALNFGVEGDKTQNVVWRITNMEVQSLKPKVVVILIGTNNTANTSHEIADGIKAIVVNVQADFPGVKIILVSILPNERANTKMMQVNSLIRGTADGSIVYYLDLVPLMPAVTITGADGRPDTGYKGIGPDHLNPNAKGYEIWADAMEPLLKNLLGEK
jgi:lysophospholipase L1-like esterase